MSNWDIIVIGHNQDGTMLKLFVNTKYTTKINLNAQIWNRLADRFVVKVGGNCAMPLTRDRSHSKQLRQT